MKSKTNWAVVPGGKLLTATSKLFTELGDRGEEIIFRLDDDKDNFRKRVAEFMLRGGISESQSQKVARAVLGLNMVGGIEEWAVFHGVKFTKTQLKSAENFPWNEDILNAPCQFVKGKTIKETHVAFLGLEKVAKLQSTIIGFQTLYPAGANPKFYSYATDSWYISEKFATEVTLKFRWYLMLENIVPNSESKTYDEQKAMLLPEYEPPTAVENVAKDLFTANKKGKFPNSSRYGRCDTVSSSGDRVRVGHGDSDRLHVDRWWDDDPRSFVGVSASRKLPS